MIFEAMGEFSAEHRAVVQLRLVDEMSLEETAQLLRCRPGTVNSRLHYACEHLRRKLVRVKKTSELRNLRSKGQKKRREEEERTELKANPRSSY